MVKIKIARRQYLICCLDVWSFSFVVIYIFQLQALIAMLKKVEIYFANPENYIFKKNYFFENYWHSKISRCFHILSKSQYKNHCVTAGSGDQLLAQVSMKGTHCLLLDPIGSLGILGILCLFVCMFVTFSKLYTIYPMSPRST